MKISTFELVVFRMISIAVLSLILSGNVVNADSINVTGYGKLAGKNVSLGLTDSRFIMGSMGSVVVEKLGDHQDADDRVLDAQGNRGDDFGEFIRPHA